MNISAMKWLILLVVILCSTNVKPEFTPRPPQCDDIQLDDVTYSYYPGLVVVLWKCSILYTHVMTPPRCSFLYDHVRNKNSFVNAVDAKFVEDEVRIAWKGDPVVFKKDCAMRLPVAYLLQGSYKFRSTWELPIDTLSVDSSGVDMYLSNKMTCSDPHLTNSKQEMSMSCWGSGPYPRVSCHLQHSQDNGQFTETYGESTSVVPRRCAGDPPNCFYNCTVTKKLEELGVGIFRFKMLVAPEPAEGLTVSDYKTSGPTLPIHLAPLTSASTIPIDNNNPVSTTTNPVDKVNPVSTSTIPVDKVNPVSTTIIPVDKMNPVSTPTIPIDIGQAVFTPIIQVDKGKPVLKYGPPQIASTGEVSNVHYVLPGADLKIYITVIGYPEPTDYMLAKIPANPKTRKRDAKQGRVDGSSYNVTFQQEKPPNGIVVLEMFGLDYKDSGHYALTISNGIGDGLVFKFHVLVTPLSSAVEVEKKSSGPEQKWIVLPLGGGSVLKLKKSSHIWELIGIPVVFGVLVVIGCIAGLLVGNHKRGYEPPKSKFDHGENIYTDVFRASQRQIGPTLPPKHLDLKKADVSSFGAGDGGSSCSDKVLPTPYIYPEDSNICVEDGEEHYIDIDEVRALVHSKEGDGGDLQSTTFLTSV